jgi:hypothetical protein
MKTIDIENVKHLPGKRIEAPDTFCFRCYPGIACFNQCCRNLNLFLYPYDVIRLKKALNLTSDEFLEQYVEVVMRPDNFFPEVLLKMSETDDKACPFLLEAGCSVYQDRPDTCRTFPIEQGLLHDADKNEDSAVYFFKPPEFCLGQFEKDEWTVASWAQDQEAAFYNEMTMRWARFKRLFGSDPWGAEGPQGPRGKMAFMAVYNIDRFREFVFNSSFLKRYSLADGLIHQIESDDVALLLLAFDWVQHFLWGMPSKRFKGAAK